MELKTVNGLGRKAYVRRAYEVAMDKAFNPTFVEAWAKWFDEAEADADIRSAGINHNAVMRPFEDGDLDAVTVSGVCIVAKGEPEDCANFDKSGCANCERASSVVCADDCPQPEYYAADLEEVAVMQTARIEAALIQMFGQTHPMSDGSGSNREAPSWLTRLFAELQAELKTPGYAVGLIPE